MCGMSETWSLVLGLVALVLLIAFNALFVAAEFAFVGVRRTRIEQLAGAGRARARLLLTTLTNLEGTIAATQLGITMAGLALGWIGEPVLARLLEPPVDAALWFAGPRVAGIASTAIAFLIVTSLVIIFAELAPKSIALARTEEVAFFVAPPVAVFAGVFRPFVWFLHRSGGLVVRPLGIRPRGGEGESLDPEELELVIEASARAGFLSTSELMLARRALEFSAIQADLADREALKRGFDEAIAQLGTLDILVNCHGITHLQKAEEFPIEVWDQMLEINLTSVFLLCQLAGRVMLDKGRGKIINIASMLSFVGGTLAPSYAASKAGLAQLTKALSNEWAGRGINVNAIAPGYIDTEMTRPRLTANPERKRQILERIPIGRLGTSEELMGIAVFLAARASDYVCGAVIPVDGGFLAR